MNLPDKIAKFAPKHDHVSYGVYYVKEELEYTYKDTACYGNIHNTDESRKINVHCFPNKQSALSNETYLKWMDICQENGLFPDDAKFYINDEKQVLDLVHFNNKHKFYIALCCYRFADSYPAIAWTTVELYNKNINFFQALHYALAKHYVPKWGCHSFCAIASTDNYYAYFGNNFWLMPKTCLLGSISLYRFVNTPVVADSASYTTGYVNSPVLKLGFKPNEFNSLSVSHLDHLLWKEWEEFYKNPDLTKPQLVECFKSVNEHSAKKTA